NDPVRAEAENGAALKLHEELMKRDPTRLGFAVNYASSCGNQAKYLHDQDKWRESLDWYARTIDTISAVLAVEKRHTEARRVLHGAHLGRAGAYLSLKQPDEAAKDWRRTV